MHLIVTLLLLAALPQAGAPANDNVAALFQRGETFEQFLSGVAAQRELWLKNASEATAPADAVDRLRRVGSGLQFLVVAEDWCPDSVNVVPYIAKLAAASRLPLRIVDRAVGAAIMKSHHAPDGRGVTPTVVLLRHGHDVGAWVERPAPLQRLFASMATDPDAAKRFANRQAWYDSDRGSTIVAEVVALAELTAARK
jgi:hypothetical protein